ncbi:MAG: transcription antitermination factor NusB [Planctomycetota bacterium]|nr:transcription antitermination factor NusB [Planctomycetota bacterium]
MGKRRRGRALALQYLYMCDVLGEKVRRPLTEFIDYWAEEEGDDKETREFASRLATLALACREEADAEAAAISFNWKVERMAVVDRNIIRLAFAELKYEKDTPCKVILDEAVELAKEFSSEESGSFVNGILDALCGRLRPETAVAAGDAGSGTAAASGSAASGAADPGTAGSGAAAPGILLSDAVVSPHGSGAPAPPAPDGGAAPASPPYGSPGSLDGRTGDPPGRSPDHPVPDIGTPAARAGDMSPGGVSGRSRPEPGASGAGATAAAAGGAGPTRR